MDITQLDLTINNTSLVVILATSITSIVSGACVLLYTQEKDLKTLPPLKLTLPILTISIVILSSSFSTITERTVHKALVVQNTNNKLILKSNNKYASVSNDGNESLRKGDIVEIKQVNWKIGYLFEHPLNYKIERTR